MYEITNDIHVSEEGVEYVGYGIQIDSGWIIRDITVRHEELAQLVEQCNRLQVSPVHILEVVEDWFGGEGL